VLGTGAPVAWDHWEESQLLRALEEATDPSAQEAAARRLAERRSLRAIPRLLRLQGLPEPPRVPTRGLVSVDPPWFTAALDAICEARPVPSFRELVKCLRHDDTFVREQAAWSLYGAGPWLLEALPELRKALDDPDEAVQTGAARALWQAGEGPDEGAFVEPFRITDNQDVDGVRSYENGVVNMFGLTSAGGLSVTSMPQGVDQELHRTLVEAISGDDTSRSWNAVVLVELLGSRARPLLPELISLLADPRRRPREHAARAIEACGAGTQEAVPALIPLLSAREREVRIAAWHALRTIWGTREVFRRARENGRQGSGGP